MAARMPTDLNTASQRDLERLPGIGPVIARRIIDARPFASIAELQRVNGIGPKRYLGLTSSCFVSVDTDRKLEVKRENIKVEITRDTKPEMKSDDPQPIKSNRLVDINSASLNELQTLHGVGPVIAERIVEARPFYRKEQIMAVKGIGPITYEKMKHQLRDVYDTGKPSTSCEGVRVKDDDPQPAQPTRQSVTAMFGQFTCRESVDDIRRDLFTGYPRMSSKLLIASWNIRNLSKKRDAPHLQRIVSIIDEFDLVALQEVRDTMVLKRLKNLMFGWDFVVSPLVGAEGSSTRTEHFAFFYRRSAFRPVGKPSLSTKSYTSVRPPFVAHFETRDRSNPIQLTLVNVHVVCGDREARQEEVDELRSLAAHIRMEQEPAYRRNLVMLGDFNLPPQDIGRMGHGGCQFEPVLLAPLSTTIAGKLYDNIWLDIAGDWPIDLEIESGVHRIDWIFYPASRLVPRTTIVSTAVRELALRARMQCSTELSDHCPVWFALGGMKHP